MNDADGQSASEQSWKQFYEAVLRESDPNVLQQKIADAQKAIGERALALLRENGHNHSEKEALVGAHALLDHLKRIHRTAERTPKNADRDGGMSESEKKDWRELCVAVASENDPKKLGLLLQELLRALDDRQSQSQVAWHQTVTTNRSFAIK